MGTLLKLTYVASSSEFYVTLIASLFPYYLIPSGYLKAVIKFQSLVFKFLPLTCSIFL